MGAKYDDSLKVWRWRRQIRLPTGEKRRGSGTPEINTKRAALAMEDDWVAAQRDGTANTWIESPTLVAVHEDYLAWVKLHKSFSLWEHRASNLRKHLLRPFGRLRLDRITLQLVDAFKEERVAAGAAPGSIKLQIETLTNLLRWAQRRGLIRDVIRVENVPAAIRDPDDDALAHLEPEQVATLLATATGDLRTMIHVAILTGLRIGELTSLRWTDLDLTARRMTVKHNTYRGKDRPPKNKRERTVPLCRTVVDLFKAYRHLKGPLVFSDGDGARLPYSTCLQRAKRVGLAGWHVTRHTFGTTLAAEGVPLRALQEWMGHADIRTTMVYAKYSPVYNEAINVLDEPKTWQRRATENG
jgi:integrase